MLAPIINASSSSPDYDSQSRIILNESTQSIDLKNLLTATESVKLEPVDWLDTEFKTENYQASLTANANAYWYRINFSSDALDDLKRKYFLVVETQVLEHLDVYQIDNKKITKHQNFSLKQEGLKSPHDVVEVNSASRSIINFDFELGAKQSTTLLLRKQSQGPGIIPLTLYSEQAFKKHQMFQYIFWGGVLCVLIMMGLYNALIYALKPSSTYRWYVLFHIIVLVYFAAISGFGYQLWPRYIQVFLIQHILFLNFILFILVLGFSLSFLEAKTKAAKYYTYSKYIFGLFILGAIGSLVIPEHQFLPFFIVIQTVGSIYILTLAVYAYTKVKFEPAFYFLLSWVFVIIGGAIGAGTYIGFLPANFFTLNGLLFGTLLEMLLLSVALADRIKYLEVQDLSKAYLDPQTNLPNFSLFKSYFPSQLKKYISESTKLVLIVVEVRGLNELIGFIGPQIFEKKYKSYLAEINKELQSSEWALPMELPSKELSYLISLPHGQLLLVAKLDISKNGSYNVEELFMKTISVLKLKSVRGYVDYAVGSTVISHRNENVTECFRQAQVALRSASHAGLTSMRYQEHQDAVIDQRLVLLEDLRRAIKNKDFSIYIQPQLELKSKKIVSGEVLVRWKKADKMVSPAYFIPIAEQSGLIFDITQMVLDKACKWLYLNQEMLPQGFRLSVNLSALDLEHPELISFINESVVRYQIDPLQITFEVTESASMRDSKLFYNTINALKGMGFSIAIDDFGTGYSSLTYLQKIQAEEIKLDLSFVRKIHESVTNQQIVSSMILLAHSMGMRTVAEGVEEEKELRWLEKEKCDLVQGYYYHRPLPENEFTKLVIVNRRILDLNSKSKRGSST